MVRLPTWQCFRVLVEDSGWEGKGLSMVELGLWDKSGEEKPVWNKEISRINSSDGSNTRDGVKIADEVIGSGGVIGFSEELKELLPAEAGK
ncbi:hypothetical protein Tco_0281808 [Tanacetum coccineum]